MMQTGEGDNIEQASKAKSIELFNLKKTTEGITETIKDFVPDIEAGIAQVDNSMQSIINQMGQGQGIAQGIKEEYSQAAIEVIKLGGTQEKALEIQTKTIDALGRNVVLSAEQTKNLFAAQQVSGVQIDVLEKAFINAGKSIKDISKEMLQVREVANNMGVNAKAVSALVVQNLDKLNRYGFQNGVEGLAKMAASSQALGIDMNETLDLADDLMSPERSMEVAAMFQRMGASSAALTNPLKLMDLSMNDTAKLQEELGDYFKSFAKFNEKTGQFEIAKSERLKIKQLSQELGISREQVEKMALAGADLDRKLSKISFAGFNVDEETQQMVANMAVMGEGGEYVIKTKDESGKLIEQSVQDFIASQKGDKEAIKAALGATEEAATKRPIEEIATDQLSALSKIQAGIETLEKSPGLTAGASKLGADLLKANQVLADSINQSFGEQFAAKTKEGEDTEYKKSLDSFGSELDEALKKAGEPGANLKEISKNLLGAGIDFSKSLGNVVAKGSAKALEDLGDVTGAEQILKDAKLEEKLQKGIDEIREQIETKNKDGEFNIGKDGVFNINEQNVGKLNIGGEFNIGKTLDIDQIDAKNVVLGEGAESIVSGQVEEIKKIGDGVTETNKQLIEAQGKLSTDIKEQSESVESQEIKVITESEVSQPTIVKPEVTPVIEQNITPEKGITVPETEGGELNIGEGGPTGFVPQVGPALAQVGGTEGLNIEDFIQLNEFLGSNLEKPIPTPTTENEIEIPEFKEVISDVSKLLIDPSKLINLSTNNVGPTTENEIDFSEIEQIIANTLKSTNLSTNNVEPATKIEPIVTEESGLLNELKVGTSETGILNSQNLVIGGGLENIITPKEREGITTPIGAEIPKVIPTPTPIPTAENTQVENIEGELSSIEQLKVGSSEIQTLNVQNLNIGTALNDIVTALNSIPEKQEQVNVLVDEIGKQQKNVEQVTAKPETQNIKPEAAIAELPEVVPTINVEETLPEITKELPTTPKTNEGEDVMSKYSVIDKDGNKTISPMGRREMKQLSEKEKEYEGEKGGFLDKILPKEQTIEDKKDLKITTDNTETLKLGNNLEKISNEIIKSSDKTSEIFDNQSKSLETIVQNNTEEQKSTSEKLSTNFQTSLKDVKDLKITSDSTETIKLGGSIEKLTSEVEILSDKNIETSNNQSEQVKSFVESSKSEQISNNEKISDKFASSLEKSSKEISELKIRQEPKKVELGGPKQEIGFKNFEPKILSTDNTETIKLGNDIEKLSTEIITSADKTSDISKSQSESIKSFVENNSKELQSSNQTLSNNFESSLEKIKDLKITTDNTETIKLGKNVENIFTKFENQSDSVKSVLEKNSKSTDIFTELANTNKTILEKTKDEGTNVKTSILNETTDTFINKINEGVEIANKTEEKKNQLSEIQNTITDKDFERRVAISESVIRDLDIAKQQIQISTENALLVEKEKENVETISNFKESDFDKRVEESESLISALDKEIEKQKNFESTVDSTKTLTEQMSNLYKEENFLTVTKPIDSVENETEPNVVNASPIQPTIAPIELTNKNVKPEELSTKVQDFLANQPKQEDKVGSNEPIKIETKLTIDGDPRFASLLDARKLQETIEGVMTKSIGKPQFAQKISTGTQRANMGMIDK